MNVTRQGDVTLGSGQDKLEVAFGGLGSGYIEVRDFASEDSLKLYRPGYTHEQILDLLDTNNDRYSGRKDAGPAFDGDWGVSLNDTTKQLVSRNRE